MRLAIRMASMFAFFIGSVIVFYTMRFSVAMRVREFALLLCLGEHQRNVALSLVLESIILGVLGTLAGILAARPVASGLLAMGISTTGRTPSPDFSLPSLELSLMTVISLLIVLLGVISPVRTLYRLQIAQVLQPRFLAGGIDRGAFHYGGFSWLIGPVLLASYLAVRPFLANWLSVVYFFLFEAVFIVVLTLLTLWLTRPFLRLAIRLIELASTRLLPLETLLTVRRLRLTSRNFVFSITSVILVFSLLAALHALTRSLKNEIYHWSSEAMLPYVNYELGNMLPTEEQFLELEQRSGLMVFRLSAKVTGNFPIRIVHGQDFERHRESLGLPPLERDQVIFSRTLAARFGANEGDLLLIDSETDRFEFEIVAVSDAIGTVAENAQYVDLKSYALFSDGNPLFRGNLDRTLGAVAVARRHDGRIPRVSQYHLLEPWYRYTRSGAALTGWKLREIDKDFLIFDFILLMTIILAFIGVVNTLLIQVHNRGRELSILRTLGVDRSQIFRLLLTEGLVIGVVGAFFATALGTALGMVTVTFLDHFTLFEYGFVWSGGAALAVAVFAVFTCSLSAIYPALVANRISTSESLHYE
jgi:putative ABC transport system permease protein